MMKHKIFTALPTVFSLRNDGGYRTAHIHMDANQMMRANWQRLGKRLNRAIFKVAQDIEVRDNISFDGLDGSRPVTRRRIVERSSYDGPLPHPEILKKYGELVPDAPERILKIFEVDSAHARVLTLATLNAQGRDNARVHWMAFSLIVGGYGIAVLLALLDKDVLAGIVLTSTIVGTVVGFLQGRRKTRIDRPEEE